MLRFVTVMSSIIMLNVIMRSVVAPSVRAKVVPFSNAEHGLFSPLISISKKFSIYFLLGGVVNFFRTLCFKTFFMDDDLLSDNNVDRLRIVLTPPSSRNFLLKVHALPLTFNLTTWSLYPCLPAWHFNNFCK